MRQLNFAGVPFRNERLPWFVYGLAVAALLATTVIHGVTLTRYFMREQEELDVKVASLQTELNGLEADILRTQEELSTQRDRARTEKIQFLAALFRRRSFSWTGFFNELESLTPAPVRITSIAPGGVGPIDSEVEEELEIQIQIVARSLDDILEMMSRLESNQLYASVLPLRESEGGQTVEGVAATLTLNYLPQRDKPEAEPEIAPAIDEDMPGDEPEEIEAPPPEGLDVNPSSNENDENEGNKAPPEPVPKRDKNSSKKQ